MLGWKCGNEKRWLIIETLIPMKNYYTDDCSSKISILALIGVITVTVMD